MKHLAVLLLVSIHSRVSIGPSIAPQVRPAEYPKGYFRNPLDVPIQLSANFGELRSNHFHMGLDIRTQQRENLPVRAAAEGYVSKIKIERYGFGRAIYINHPNGYTTLYAHLNDFYPALHNHVINQQYQDEQWEQEINFTPEQFPVTKGQLIAYSGNTGGSQGPHLHFEIRDTYTGNNLNPWLFDFGIPDKIHPEVHALYYYDRRYSTYQTTPRPIAIKGVNGKYASVSNVVSLLSPYVSFGIAAEDKNVASSFRYGIYQASMSIDNTVQSSFTMDDISYDDTRYINASIDYKTKASGGRYIQHLSKLPGNYTTIFSSQGDGTILLTDTAIHTAEIAVKDATGNTSVVTFKFRWDPSKTNDLMWAANSIALPPNQQNELKTDDLQVVFSPRAFYDTIPFVVRSEVSADKKVVSSVHHLHHFTVPVHDSFTVSMKPTALLAEADSNKVVMQLTSNRKIVATKGQWSQGFMQAKFRDLGMVKLILDTVAPRIALSGWTNGATVRSRKSIAVVATDNVGELKSFRATLDGNWLMFSRKDDSFIHNFDQRTTPGKHELTVTAEDMAGNITQKTFWFTR